MKITLRMMSEKEFEAYSDYSINDYANDLLKSSEMTKEEALLQAKKRILRNASRRTAYKR